MFSEKYFKNILPLLSPPSLINICVLFYSFALLRLYYIYYTVIANDNVNAHLITIIFCLDNIYSFYIIIHTLHMICICVLSVIICSMCVSYVLYAPLYILCSSYSFAYHPVSFAYTVLFPVFWCIFYISSIFSTIL
jgi:hypothetical protein